MKISCFKKPTAYLQNMSAQNSLKLFLFCGFGVRYKTGHPGRPSMDILVRSWQDLAKILEKS